MADDNRSNRAINTKAKKPSQLSLISQSDEFKNYWKMSGRRVHGGAYATGKRKTMRPFDSKKPMHVVMRSEKARGSWSMRSPHLRGKIDTLVFKWARKTGVKLYTYANGGNHLHLLIRAKHRSDFQRFLRITTALVARTVTQAKKGTAKGRFWSGLTFSRIADWSKSFLNLRSYVIQNVLESAGLVTYKPRRARGPP